MMRMSVSVISEYRIGYRYRLILLLNIGYRNNRLIWISVQHYLLNSKNRKIDLYSKYWDNKLQALTKTVVT